MICHLNLQANCRSHQSRIYRSGSRSILLWQHSWPLVSRKRPQSCSLQSYGLSGISMTGAEWHMTVATVGKFFPRRTWTGQSPMPAYTTRHSQAAPEQYPIAPLPPGGSCGAGARNPNRPWFGWFPDTPGYVVPPHRPSTSRLPQLVECCHRYDDGRCKQTLATCQYAHKCLNCSGPHPHLHCPRGGQKGPARPRSPIQPRQAYPQPDHRY